MRMRQFVFAFLTSLICAASAMAQGVTLPAAERIVLDNGTVIILNVKRDVPLIAVRAVLKGGAIADPEGKDGLASLFASLLEKGAGDRDAAAFADAIDAVGGNLSAFGSLENITISGDFLARNEDLMIELLADMLMRPALDAAEFEKLRDRAINFILAAKGSDPGDLMPLYANAALFAGHPYSRPVDGSETSLATIDDSDVQAFYRQQVGADRLILSLSGDFDAESMATKLTERFADWRAAESPLAGVGEADEVSGTRVLLIDKPDATQTYFWIGNLGVAVDFEQRAGLDLANTLFGGRFTSMLNTALRIDSGLTYGARSRLLRPAERGSVGISSYTATESTVEAIDMALGVLDQLHDPGINDEMLQSARAYVLGQFPTRLETANQLARQFATLEEYGLGVSYINAYGDALVAETTASLADVIDRVYPSRENLLFVLLGNAEAIREDIKKYGPVTEMSITEPLFAPAIEERDD